MVEGDVVALAMDILMLGRYALTAAYALVVYDWIISVGDEIDLVLHSKWNVMKMTYLVCRYYPLFVYPVYMWAWLGDHPAEVCADVVKPLYGLFIIFQLTPQTVVLLRTYAFTGRKTTILVLLSSFYALLVIGGVIIFATSFELASELFSILGNSGCFGHIRINPPGSNSTVLMGLFMIGTFCFDLLTIFMVVQHCVKRGVQGFLGKVFVAQGLLVFVTMSVLNLITATVYFSNDRQYHGIGLQLNFLFSDVLACRLILTIRRVARPTDSEISRMHSGIVRDALEHLEVQARPSAPTEGPGPPSEQRTFQRV